MTNDSWTHVSNDGIATNPDPITGGIIDSEIVSGKWFVIPNNNAFLPGDGFTSKSEAFKFLSDQIEALSLESEMPNEFKPK